MKMIKKIQIVNKIQMKIDENYKKKMKKRTKFE